MDCFKPLFSGVIVAAASFAASGAAHGAMFTLEPGSADFPTVTSAGATGQASLTSVAQDGITLTVTAAGGNGVIAGSLNGNDGFGVAGNGSFDINGSESLSLTFNQDVSIDQLSFDVFSFGESVDVAIASLSIATNVTGNQAFTPSVAGIAAAGNANGDFTLNFTAETFTLAAGDAIVISSGSSILVDSVSVTAAVPEPASLALLALGVPFMMPRRKR